MNQEPLHPEALKLWREDTWSIHPDFRRSDWREEVANHNTQLGYWDWLDHQLEARDEDGTPIRCTPDNIQTLAPNEVFVFGSNLAGRHGAGAAKLAYDKFGACYTVGVGHEGHSYAIPTKDVRLNTLPLSRIEGYVEDFLVYARSHPELTFLVTQIGCGLAGYNVSDIAPLFFKSAVPCNVVLPEAFWRVINPYR